MKRVSISVELFDRIERALAILSRGSHRYLTSSEDMRHGCEMLLDGLRKERREVDSIRVEWREAPDPVLLATTLAQMSETLGIIIKDSLPPKAHDNDVVVLDVGLLRQALVEMQKNISLLLEEVGRGNQAPIPDQLSP